ncbi:MAG: bifunctional hydroxymethylpyrimidine kinase/phosphomethylpyrimidine kinase [Burkholderiaceae bacterium]
MEASVAKRPCVLVFAGADPSGGAGIQADIQAIAAQGAHALTVITALTVQDNDRVYAVHPVATELLIQQAQTLIDKIEIAAVKIGIVANAANAQAIAQFIITLRQRQPDLPVVLDPVLASGHGDALAKGDIVAALAPLIEAATLITPNLMESVALCSGEPAVERQAAMLLQRGCKHVLIKGGHGPEDQSVRNRWFSQAHSRIWEWPRLPGGFHGSGCTLASAIAGVLAVGNTMEEAIDRGQSYCQRALEHAYPIAAGQKMPARTAAA